jgi:heme o synthase
MKTSAYRRLLLTSAVATFILIVSGGVVSLSGGAAACPDWPLCSGQLLPPWRMDAWIEYVHRLLTLVVTLLIAAGSLVAWRRRDRDPWVRRPPLVAPALLLLQILLGAVIVWFNSPELMRMFHLGMATSILAALIIPAIALSVENSSATDGSHLRRGGRAMQRARRYRRLVFGTALATWLLLLTSVGLAETSTRSSTAPQLGGLGAMLETGHHWTLLLVGLLMLGVFWTTWRNRRQDRLLLTTVLLAGGLLLTRAGAGTVGATTMPALLTGLHLALWSALVVLSILALRRPIPALVTMPAGGTVGTVGTVGTPGAVAKTDQQPSLISDYLSLTKPKVIMLLLFTTLAAMFITEAGTPSPALVFWTMLGGYLAAGGAGAINCAFDQDIDINMGRTSRRPVPSGRISRRNAFWFGIALCVAAFAVLAVFTTWPAAVLAMIGAVYYSLFYTRWLKRTTWQNIVIGGGAGSIPPLVGWAAVTGTLTLPAVLLFAIVFYWTPPHFWALALVKEKDYARAGVPMLPVVAGETETRRQILLYSVLMVGITLLLVPLQAMGLIYLGLALLFGGIFLRYAWDIWREGGQKHIWGMYKYSLLYLALLFAAMILDRMVLG